MWGLCMPNFRPPASLEWEEIEVMEARVTLRPIPTQNLLTPPSLWEGKLWNDQYISLKIL